MSKCNLNVLLETLIDILGWVGGWVYVRNCCNCLSVPLLSGVPDFFVRNKILSGGDLSHYQVPHCNRVFFYFV